MKLKGLMNSFMVLSFISLSAGALLGQTAPPAQLTNASGAVIGIIGPAPTSVASSSPWFASNGAPIPAGNVLTGAPYSAEQVTEHVQTLSDGSHITQQPQTTKFYRDSQGRTRTERSAPLPPGFLGKGVDAPVFIEISDPVSGVRYTFDSKGHTAHKSAIHPVMPPPPAASANSATPASRAVRILPAIVPAPSGAVQQDPSTRPQFSHESLGAQTIEGVLAEGIRTTAVYPVGAVGNDRQLVTTTEVWTSPELKTVVLSKTTDPRSGDSTMRLTNISRAEPDASLFQPPPDYEIAEPK